MRMRGIPSAIAEKRRPLLPGELVVSWLGQAGFLMEFGCLRIVVDAYLSDSLARKYAGKEFPHIRMTPPPVAPGALRDIDYVFASHGHTDHLDPDSVGPLHAANPGCRFVVPAAETETAEVRGLPRERLIPVDAGEKLDLGENVSVDILASAHETLRLDSRGRNFYLGFVFNFGGLVVYHSGDCVPYPALRENLAAFRPLLALLPVNGRDEYRGSRGIAGNFTLEEAVTLAEAAGCHWMLGHHHGLFDFNTIDREEASARLATLRPDLSGRYILVSAGVEYRIGP